MTVEVTNNTGLSRYEIRVDGELAGWADYESSGSTFVFPHTEIDPALRGRGLAATLVKEALDDVRRSGGSVVAHCWYVARFISEHPGYADLLAA